MDYERTINIEATPATVWRVLSDVERWPEWTPSMRSIELLDGTLAVGSRVRIRQPRFPAVTWEVTALEPARGFTWRSRSPGSDAVADHTIADDGDGSSTVTLRITQTGVLGTVVGVVTRRLTKRYVDLEARGLKARSERTD